MSKDSVGGSPQLMADPSDSVAFRASREAAASLLGDPAALRWLMQVVDIRLRADDGTGVASHLHLDIAEAIVEAHVEELQEPALTDARLARLRTDPRCLVVVAALHYVATPRCPAAADHTDELEMLRWATDVARSELPVS